MQAWDDARMTSFDFETSGKLPEYALQPWRIPRGDAWVTSASALRHDGQNLVPQLSKLFATSADVRAYLEWVIANDKIVVGWNLVFDISVCIGIGLADLIFKVKWLDGMLLWKHLEIEPEYEFQTAKHKKKSYALKPGAVEQWIPTFAGLDEDVDFHSTEPESLAKLQRYNDRDNVRSWVITKMIWDKLLPSQRKCALIEAEALPIIAQANFHGMVVDPLTCKELSAHLTNVAADKLAALAPHGMTEKIVRSPKQLSELMFDQWMLPVLKINKSKTTGNETRSTDKEVLHELAFQDNRVKLVQEYREALNNRAKFADALTTSVDYNDDNMRTHPLAIPFGTYSGRLTYASKQGKNKDARPIGFAIHQMNRKKMFREVLVAPEGYTMVEFDAAGQEFRWMAICTRDQNMLHLCTPGEDAHSFMGAQIVGKDYHDLIARFATDEPDAVQERYLGKFANLSCQYRTGVKKLRSKARTDYLIPLEMPEAHRIHATYQRTYPGVPAYWATQIAKTRSQGYVETLGGRRVSVVGDWDGKYGWSMGSTSINYRIQGTGADQKFLALMCLKSYLTQIGAYFVWDMHDGIYFYIPDDKVASAVVRMKAILDNLPYQQAWGLTPPIPLPWDCKHGKSWGKMKEWKFQ